MSDDQPIQAPRTLVIVVVIVVGLAFAGVLAMIIPSGDQGQSRDTGPPALIPSIPPVSTGVPIIKVESEASLVPGDAGSQLSCTFSFNDIPADRTTVIHIVASGAGTGPVPLLHPGEEAVGNTARASEGPTTQARVTQDLADPSGRYSCKLVAVMTSYGPARLEGELEALVRTGD